MILIHPQIKLAVSNNIPFLATSGRHGYSSRLGQLQNGLQIDLSNLNKIEVDAGADTVTVGPGVQFKDILEPLYAAGKEMSPLTLRPEPIIS